MCFTDRNNHVQCGLVPGWGALYGVALPRKPQVGLNIQLLYSRLLFMFIILCGLRVMV